MHLHKCLTFGVHIMIFHFEKQYVFNDLRGCRIESLRFSTEQNALCEGGNTIKKLLSGIKRGSLHGQQKARTWGIMPFAFVPTGVGSNRLS